MSRHMPGSRAPIVNVLLSYLNGPSAHNTSEDCRGVTMTTVSVGRMKAFTKAATLYCATMLWMLASTGGAFGQQSSASVTGLVKDASGANIPAAQVRLRNIETNVSRETVSNDTGNYTFLNVPPGKYTLDFSAQGFQLEAVTAFELNVNQTPVHSVDAREASILLSTHLFRQA